MGRVCSIPQGAVISSRDSRLQLIIFADFISLAFNLSREDKEAMMLDTIYEMAKTIERLHAKIERLEGDIQQIKEDAAEAHYWAHRAS